MGIPVFCLAVGDSNSVLNQAGLNITQQYLNTVYGVGVKTQANMSISGMASNWGAANIDNFLSIYTAQICMIGLVTNDALDSIDSGLTRLQMYTEWKSNTTYMIATVKAAGVTPVLYGPPPSIYEYGYNDFQTRLKILMAAQAELAIDQGVELYQPYSELCMRDAIGNADEFSAAYRAASDKYHYKNPEGVVFAGTQLANAGILAVRKHVWGGATYPAWWVESFATCWLTGCTLTDTDKGPLAMANGNVCLSPCTWVGDYDKETTVTVTPKGDSCADVYMRTLRRGFNPGNTIIPWVKTNSILRPVGDCLLQWKLVGTSSGNITSVEMDWL